MASLLPTRQKAPLRQKFQCPLVLSKPLPLLVSSRETRELTEVRTAFFFECVATFFCFVSCVVQ
ncbi:hypothetical protein C6Y54_07600 [Bacillus cereus]|nr:hypothetical protein C6Y54_07600 [Bacillus cereus]